VAGIGQGRVTDNLAQDIALLDGAFTVPDGDTIRMVYHLLDRDGLYVGASTALNVVAAKQLAVKLGKGSRVVTILCDGAYRCVPLLSLSSLSLLLGLPASPGLQRERAADLTGERRRTPQVPVAPLLQEMAREQEPLRRDPRRAQEVRRAAVDGGVRVSEEDEARRSTASRRGKRVQYPLSFSLPLAVVEERSERCSAWARTACVPASAGRGRADRPTTPEGLDIGKKNSPRSSARSLAQSRRPLTSPRQPACVPPGA